MQRLKEKGRDGALAPNFSIKKFCELGDVLFHFAIQSTALLLCVLKVQCLSHHKERPELCVTVVGPQGNFTSSTV